MVTKDASLRSTVYRVSVRAAIAIVAAVSILLFTFDTETPVNLKISAVAAGLASSLLYTVLFNWQTNRSQQELLKSQIGLEFEKHSNDIVQIVATIAENHVPSNQYAGTAGFDSRFNRDIQADIRASRLYLFRGASAKYVPARLMASPNSLESVRILIDHPGDTSAFRRRVADRQMNSKYAGRSYAELGDELQLEIVESIVALFDIRSKYRIEIALLKSDPSVTRVEVFDRACFVSLYRSTKAQEYPETLRYDAGTILNDMFRLECVRQFEDSERIEFQDAQEDESLLSTIHALGVTTFGPRALYRARAKNKEFTDSFIRKLHRL